MSLSNNFPTIKPSLNLDFANTKRLDPRVTFTRSTTGTYYDGVTTAKAEENLLLYSQEFNQSIWGKVLGTVTANADTAPDGTLTADLFTPSDPGSRVEQSYIPAGATQYIFSVWLRSATGSSFSIDLLSWRTSPFTTTGTTTITVTTTWQRFTLTVNSLDASLHYVVIGGGGSLTTGENIYMWGAQLEQRSSVTAYTATTTQPITNYIPVLLTAAANVPRFDHNPTTDESLGLLVEEQRTNLLTYSEQFDNAAWAKIRSSVTANTTAAPDGTVTSDKLIASTDNNSHVIYQSVAANTYTFSCYAKAAEYNFLILFTGLFGRWFNLTNGTIGTSYANDTLANIVSVGNGWYRCSITFTNASSDNVYIGLSSADGVIAFAGNNFNGIYIWGAQLEAGSFATSYIATTAASATRTADAALMTGNNFSSWFNNQEGTIYYSGVLNGRRTSGFENVAIFTNGTATTDSFGVGTEVFGNDLRAFVLAGGTLQADLRDGAPQVGTQFKGAFAYQANDFAFCADNGTVQTDSSGLVPSGIDRVTFGVEPAGGSPYNGTINKVAYYPQRITDAQVKALTS